MSTVQPTDKVLVNRAGTDHSITAGNLMATVQDTDLLLVNRAGVDYKCSGADFKAAMGPGLVAPAPADVSAVPAFASGTGTQADPYILAPVTVGGAGGTGQSVEVITVANTKAGQIVEWKDNSTPNPNTRFKQAVDVAAGTTWSGRLTYTDTPASTVSGAHTGDLQIGTTYFRWVVTQDLGVAPDIATASLADVAGGNRFTSTAFPVSLEMAKDGNPASTKKLKAWVQGQLKAAAESDAITAVNQLTTGTLFATTLYTGNGSTQTITNGVDLAGEGGMVWTKSRTYGSNAGTPGDHVIDDTLGNRLNTNTTNASATANRTSTSGSVNSFNSDGFLSGPTNPGGNDYVAWAFRKSPGFFDIVTYTGDGVAGRTVAHNLGSVPGCIIVKRLDAADSWAVFHRGIGNSKGLELDRNIQAYANDYWNSTDPTSTVFSVGNNTSVNFPNGKYVAYLFAHNPAGIVQCGNFVGTGPVNGELEYLGWEPGWILLKRTDIAGDWEIYDTTRGWVQGPQINTGDDKRLRANLTTVEGNHFFGWPMPTGFQHDRDGAYIYVVIKKLAIGDATELTLASAAGLTGFAAGDAVTEIGNGNDATGVVGKVDAAANKLTVSKSTAWDIGSKVKGPLKPAGSDVKMFCTLAAGTGTVTGLQSADPGFQTWTATAGTPVFGEVPYTGTLTFPATMPSGNAPDVDMPAGTAVQVEVEASNTVGTDVQRTNLVTPA